MLLLDGVNICTEDYAAIWNIVGLVVNVIRIGIPIVLIVLGMIDFAKATISNDEKAQEKATKGLLKRFLYAVGVFGVSWIVIVVFDVVANTVKDPDAFTYDEASWKECWNLIRGSSSSEGSGPTTPADRGENPYGCYYCGGDPSNFTGGSYLYIRENESSDCVRVTDSNANASKRSWENKNSTQENASHGNGDKVDDPYNYTIEPY